MKIIKVFLYFRFKWHQLNLCIKYPFAYIYLWLNGVKMNGIIKILNFPTILKNSNATIEIGNNVTLNSDKKFYHLSMYNSCKFLADKPNSSIKIGANTRINGACLHAYNKILIGRNCLVAANVSIIDANGHAVSMECPENRIYTQDKGREIIIEDNVWIGANSLILGGSFIGSGSVITAGSVVRGTVPAN